MSRTPGQDGVVGGVAAGRGAEELLAGENRILERIAGGAALSEVLGEITRLVEGQDPSAISSVLLLDQATGRMYCGAAPNLPGEYTKAIEGIRIGPKVGSCGSAAYSGELVVVTDIEKDPRWVGVRKLPMKYGLRACWSQPIRASSGRVLGTVAHYSRAVGGPSAGQLQMLAVAAHLAGIAVEREMAERELRASEARFRATFESANAGIAHAARDGKIVRANKAYCDLVGRTWEQLDGLTFAEMTHEDDRGENLRLWQGLVEGTSERYDQEKRYVWPDGTVRWGNVTVARVYVEGDDVAGAKPQAGNVGVGGAPGAGVAGGVFAVAVAVDVTGRKEAEGALRLAREEAERAAAEARGANRAKDRFLAALSHELRTPLSPALLTAGVMAEDEGLPAGAREDARVIRRNLEMEVRLIDDLLDLNRLATGKMEMREEAVEVRGVLQACLELCGTDGAGRGVSVGWMEDGGGAREEYWVRGDAVRLQQVFCNLLKNAVKFTPAGGEVRVSMAGRGQRSEGRGQEEEIGRGWVRVEVRDTGIGIEAGRLASVFDPFEQGGRVVTKAFGGLGLGLAIAKGIVDAHGGRIEAVSEGLGKGTSVVVELPLAAAPAGGKGGNDERRTVNDERKPGGVGGGLKILLVEDHADTLRALARLLRSQRYEVITAESVAAAREAGKGAAVDVVISDVGLPDGSGLELMRELIGGPGRVAGIALTGYGTASDVEEARRAGCAAHLTKPVSFSALQAVLRRLGPAATSGGMTNDETRMTNQ